MPPPKKVSKRTQINAVVRVLHLDSEREFISSAKENNTKVLKKFLKSGIDLNCRHHYGWNALHAAVVNGSWDAVKLLVDNGADVNAKDEFSSAQRMAAQERVSNVIGLL